MLHSSSGHPVPSSWLHVWLKLCVLQLHSSKGFPIPYGHCAHLLCDARGLTSALSLKKVEKTLQATRKRSLKLKPKSSKDLFTKKWLQYASFLEACSEMVLEGAHFMLAVLSHNSSLLLQKRMRQLIHSTHRIWPLMRCLLLIVRALLISLSSTASSAVSFVVSLIAHCPTTLRVVSYWWFGSGLLPSRSTFRATIKLPMRDNSSWAN